MDYRHEKEANMNTVTPQPTAVQSGRITTEGDSLYYEVRGHGAPLIMIAGANGDADEFHLIAEILADEYKVITYDRRAKARSTMNSPQHFEISQQSRDVVAILRAVGEKSAYIFGNSSGAVIALDIAKTQPQAVRAAIIHEPPITQVHPDVLKWQRFYTSVYKSAFTLGASIAALRFLLGTGFPVRKLIKASRDGRKGLPPSTEPLIPSKLIAEFLIKQELLPVTNYLPDVDQIKNNGTQIIMAAGQMTLDHHWWYGETARILSEQLGCECVLFPGHHGSFMDMPHEFATTLRTVLHKATSKSP